MEKYQILKNLVGFNTIKDEENRKIINYIENILQEKNFKTEYKGKNLIISYGKNPKIGFLGHTDTVEYIDGWDTNPFILTEKRDKLYGLGTCDMKGGIAAILDAVLEIDLNEFKNGIKLYFTYDEERNFGGIRELIKNKEEAIELAEKIKYPVILKASAGGGGRGIRIAYSKEELEKSYDIVKQEAKISFGDDSIYLEKFIENPRHVEIQILADEHGNCIHLGERDCSIQRRNQKIIEETPSMAINDKKWVK